MPVLDDLVLKVAQGDLCFGNSVTVAEVLEEMHECQLRHCVISLPQSKEEIGECPSCLRNLPEGPDPPADDEIRKRFRIFDMKDVLYKLDEKLNECDQDIAFKETMDLLAYQVANCSCRNEYKPVWAKSTVRDIISSFQTYSRVPIFEWREDGTVYYRRMFSATDFFKLLCKYFIKIKQESGGNGDLAELVPEGGVKEDEVSSPGPNNHDDDGSGSVIEELVIKLSNIILEDVDWYKNRKRIVTINEQETVRQAIRILVSTGFSALPIVNEDQQPIGLISTSDFRMLMLESTKDSKLNSEVLYSSVVSYLSLVKRIECPKTRYPTIMAKSNASIMQVVHKLTKARIHRIFIVDQPNRLRGLFSRTDFGKILASLLH